MQLIEAAADELGDSAVSATVVKELTTERSLWRSDFEDPIASVAKVGSLDRSLRAQPATAEVRQCRPCASTP